MGSQICLVNWSRYANQMAPSEPRGAIRWESTDPGQSGQKRVEARILGRVVKTRGPSLLKRRRFSKPKKLNFQFLFFLFLFGLERETPPLSRCDFRRCGSAWDRRRRHRSPPPPIGFRWEKRHQSIDLLVLFIDLVFFLLKSQLRSTNLSWKLRGSKKPFLRFSRFLFISGVVAFWVCVFGFWARGFES